MAGLRFQTSIQAFYFPLARNLTSLYPGELGLPDKRAFDDTIIASLLSSLILPPYGVL